MYLRKRPANRKPSKSTLKSDSDVQSIKRIIQRKWIISWRDEIQSELVERITWNINLIISLRFKGIGIGSH